MWRACSWRATDWAVLRGISRGFCTGRARRPKCSVRGAHRRPCWCRDRRARAPGGWGRRGKRWPWNQGEEHRPDRPTAADGPGPRPRVRLASALARDEAVGAVLVRCSPFPAVIKPLLPPRRSVLGPPPAKVRSAFTGCFAVRGGPAGRKRDACCFARPGNETCRRLSHDEHMAPSNANSANGCGALLALLGLLNDPFREQSHCRLP